MRWFGLFIFVFSLCACQQVKQYFDTVVDVASKEVANQITQHNFSADEEAELKVLFQHIAATETCSESYAVMYNNPALEGLAAEFNLNRNFFFKSLTNLSIESVNDALLHVADKGSYITLAIITVWKKYYTINSIQNIIQSLEDC